MNHSQWEHAAAMHTVDEELLEAAFGYLEQRIRLSPAPLDRPGDRQKLSAELADVISAEGNDPRKILEIYTAHLAPTVISADSPRFFAFAPNAPTKASRLFDMIVSCASLQGISWLEAAGVVAAEEQALRFLIGLAGMPEHSRGCFVSGGTMAALSAFVVARDAAPASGGSSWVVFGDQTHSSIAQSAKVVGAQPLKILTESGRITREPLVAALDSLPPGDRVIAVAGTAGTTNAGQVDDLAAIADVCQERGIWFHVDAAYGGAALLVPSRRALFAGIERADSLVIDPHKWFFAPYDCAALLYRDPVLARRAHTQEAPYLDVIHEQDDEWNPADLAHHCSRRARGLPFWFSLAVHGTDAYRDAVERGLWLADQMAELVECEPALDLVRRPDLSVVLFRRRGWEWTDYERWAHELLDQQVAFVTPTVWDGQTVARMAFVHPATTVEILAEVIQSTRSPSQAT
ncbi:aminotransferase class I/II-fold pyridoxal phosphate-dependent enzyme [Streptomyces sp900105245]|uniref:Aminotransferase class I/II-fold pyridoxal phosphate-dependent enzyme n=1 Tax=Streptomyces sp. 900105245 TaxID=3154379 RepID=A0ABV1UM25_9ACTN